jgi:hypothetical protein
VTPQEFSIEVIVPALNAIGLYSPAAAQLLLGTAIQESGLRDIPQIGGGPAAGYFQIEFATYTDVLANFLAFRPALAEKVEVLCSPDKPNFAAVTAHPRYACAIARIKYLRVPEPLPAAGDIAAMAAFYKAHYNTPEGAATEAEFVANWEATSAGDVTFV